jgi:hypothetical protein
MLRLANDRSGWEKPIRELPDVSRFVARDPNVSAEVGRVALPVDRDGGGRVNGGKPGADGRWAPGEKPAVIGGSDGQGSGSRRATSKPDSRGGDGSSVGGADPSGARNGRPGGGTDSWRNGGSGGDSGKPAVSRRAVGDKPADATPGDSSAGSWRQRPDSGTGRGSSARVPGSGVTGKPSRPSSDDGRSIDSKPDGASSGGARPRAGSDEGWRNNGDSQQQQRRATAPRTTTRTPKPETYEQPPLRSDESWRSGGHENNSDDRPPVRRIVEGVRSNRQDSNDDAARGTVKPSHPRTVRPAEPSSSRVEPRSTSPRSQPPATSRPAPDRQRSYDKPSEPQRGSSAGRSHDSGGSRGSADRSSGSRGGGGGRDSGGGDNGGGRGGSNTRPSHADKDGGDPNR